MLFVSLIMTTLLSTLMIGFGIWFIKKPPKNINMLIGYRTSMSMKNKDTWVFAHQYAGKVWLISGVMNVIISVILALALQQLNIYDQLMFALIYVQIGVLLLVIPLTEIALRKTFDKQGLRK